MIAEAIGAYAHFLSIFMLLALLVAEAALYRQRMAAASLTLTPAATLSRSSPCSR